MASQHGPRFAPPIFHQNFPQNSFNVKPGMNRPPRPEFRTPPNPPSGPFQSSEKFSYRFQNRPQFSNFQGACGFLNRPPPRNPSLIAQSPPTLACPPSNSISRPPFPGPPNSLSHPSFLESSNSFRPPFPGPPNSLTIPPFLKSSNSSRPPFPGPPNSLSHPSFIESSNSSRPFFPGPSNSCPPFSGHSNFPSPAFTDPLKSSFPSQPSASSHPSFSPGPPPLSHHSVPSHPPPHLSQPPFSSQSLFPPRQSPPQYNQLLNVPHTSQRNQFHNTPHPPQHDQFRNMPHLSQHDSLPNMFHSSPENQSHTLQNNEFRNMTHSPQQNQSHLSQHNQFPNTSHPPEQNQFSSLSHSPHQHEGFHMNCSPSASGSQFDYSEQPHIPWNLMSRFYDSKSGTGQFIPRSRKAMKKRKLQIRKSQEFQILKGQNFSDASIKFMSDKFKVRDVKKDNVIEKPYYCDTCDRGFVIKKELTDHINQHIKCNYQNCTFEAHPKIVLLHKKMQHVSGYAERISKLKDDAEVKKWREERRKRFPTAENIRKRKAEQAEKEARGEVLETKVFGKFQRREENGDLTHSNSKRMRGHHTKRNRFRRNFHEQHPGFRNFKVKSESDSDNDSHISLNMFSGLSSLANSAEEMCHLGKTVEISSSEQNLSECIPKIEENHLNVSYSENNSTDRSIKSPIHSNAEKSRDKTKVGDESVLEIPEYEAEKSTKELILIEDTDDEGPEVIAITKCQEEIYIDEKDKETRPNVNTAAEVSKRNHVDASKKGEKIGSHFNDTSKCSNVNHEDTSKEEEKIGSHFNDASKCSNVNHEDTSKGNQSKRNSTRRENAFFAEQYAVNQIRKSTLLEKLLADDIRHERNVVLQCVRHIVNNNFFGLTVKNKLFF